MGKFFAKVESLGSIADELVLNNDYDYDDVEVGEDEEGNIDDEEEDEDALEATEDKDISSEDYYYDQEIKGIFKMLLHSTFKFIDNEYIFLHSSEKL